MLGRVVSGLRTWICTIAAPALAASSADCAICAGVTGTAGLRPGVSADPVTAHEIMTFRCMPPPAPRCLLVESLPRGWGTSPEGQMRVGVERAQRDKLTGDPHKLALAADLRPIVR